MKITQRLEDGARKAARVARELAPDSAPGPQAAYARNLDGSRLWLAIPDDAGYPALRVPASDELIDPGTDLPADTDAGSGLRSVRWPLDDVLPPADGAVLEVVVRPTSGRRARPVLTPEPAPESPARNPTTPDGRWRFVLDGRPGEPLRVRRTATPAASRLLRISATVETVTIACEVRDRDAHLFLLGSTDGAVTRLPSERTPGGLESTFGRSDLPTTPDGYKFCVGTADDHVPVMRRNADLHIPDPTNVLLPTLSDEGGDRIAARMRFAPGGVLWIQRLATADTDDA